MGQKLGRRAATAAATAPSAVASGRAAPRASLTLLTWNIWFGELAQPYRWAAISNICQDSDADVICLQEVTPAFLRWLQAQPWTSRYNLSDRTGETIGSYGVVCLAKADLPVQFSWHEFPTRMGRKLLVARLQLAAPDGGAGGSRRGGDPFSVAVGTVHLESLANRPTREKQLEITARVVEDERDAIVCGDFNFCAYRNYRLSESTLENDVLGRVLPSFVDVWSHLHDTTDEAQRGLTFDSEANPNIKAYERMRYDRVICKQTEASRLKPASIEMVGTGSIREVVPDVPSEFRDVRPSDHFGLLARFDL